MDPDLSQTLPALACDTHSHVYGNEMRYPLREGQHAVADATLDRYLHVAGRFGIMRTIFVQPKAYGNDPACMLDAISQLGVPRARGIIMPNDELSEAALNHLDRLGIRGVRFLFQDDAPVNMDQIRATAARIAALGWSLLVQGSAAALAPCLPQLAALPGGHRPSRPADLASGRRIRRIYGAIALRRARRVGETFGPLLRYASR